TDYAIRSVLYLSENRRIASVDKISKSMYVSKIFLAKILQKLEKAGILKSSKGRKGGFFIGKSPKKISLMEVIETIQGPLSINICAIDKGKCRLSRICSVHPVWVQIRKEIGEKLRKLDFERLSKEREKFFKNNSGLNLKSGGVKYDSSKSKSSRL
ncbi:MAG: RrF2 family transcriptional regulator, partial [Candidatus Aminicenantia bacterium]